MILKLEQYSQTEFSALGRMSWDQLNVIQSKAIVKKLYENLTKKSIQVFLTLWEEEYWETMTDLYGLGYDYAYSLLKKYGKLPEEKPKRKTRASAQSADDTKATRPRAKHKFTEKDIEAWLKEFDPITRYVYESEIERKMLRFWEGVATARTFRDRLGLAASISASQKLWSKQMKQYVINAVQDAHKTALKESRVTHVMWITVGDEKVCEECDEHDHKIYELDEVPDRHFNCRCWLEPVEVKE